MEWQGNLQTRGQLKTSDFLPVRSHFQHIYLHMFLPCPISCSTADCTVKVRSHPKNIIGSTKYRKAQRQEPILRRNHSQEVTNLNQEAQKQEEKKQEAPIIGRILIGDTNKGRNNPVFLSCDFLRMVPPKNAFLSLRLGYGIHIWGIWIWGIMSNPTIQFMRVSHALVDTRFECGLRLPNALRACEWVECRTRFECSLPNQGGIMSHHYM